MTAPGRHPASREFPFPFVLVALTAVLAAATIAWSAAPLGSGSTGTRPALIVAVVAGVLSIAQLAVTAAAGGPDGTFAGTDGARRLPLSPVRLLPWAEVLTVAAIVLEALHRSRPWHTAVLTVALVGYLIALHLAETRSGAGALRAQLPVLAAGAALTALAVAAAALPGLPPGTAAGFFRITAVLAAVIVAALAVPVWLVRSRR